MTEKEIEKRVNKWHKRADDALKIGDLESLKFYEEKVKELNNLWMKKVVAKLKRK